MVTSGNKRLQIKAVCLAKYRLYWTWKFNNQTTLEKRAEIHRGAQRPLDFFSLSLSVYLSVCLMAVLFILEAALQ